MLPWDANPYAVPLAANTRYWHQKDHDEIMDWARNLVCRVRGARRVEETLRCCRKCAPDEKN
jgi:hypothetical protein